MAVRESPQIQDSLRTLLISTSDSGGGAELSAWSLFNTYRKRGHESWLAVGTRNTNDPNVIAIPKDSVRNFWAKNWIRASNGLRRLQSEPRDYRQLHKLCGWIGDPRRQWGIYRGYEDFDFPGTWQIPQLVQSPQIVHCFNLHGNYFDLRALPWLSRQHPVILDLRDAWLLSGHCAHSMNCERWKIGCGECPDLTLTPAIPRDGSAFNWERKRKIFANSRLYVAAPSQWLMERIRQSMLSPAIVESRVITTGVDLSIFRPANKNEVRDILGLPRDARVLLFAANGVRRNIWKDYQTIEAAVRRLSEKLSTGRLIFVGLGDKSPTERIGNAELRFIPHVKDLYQVARYYQAADLYLHAAMVDTFPRAVIEALACGTPVVATGVGGITEQIHSWPHSAKSTGVIVPSRDAESMTLAAEKILTDDSLHRALSENATTDARLRFDLEKQADEYLSWYRSIYESRNHLTHLEQAFENRC